MNILFLATAWGPKFGGINAFNKELAVGLAEELSGMGRIFCATPNPTDMEVADAEMHKVILIPIRSTGGLSTFDSSWVYEIVEWLRFRNANFVISWWIGHDVITGNAALRGHEIAGGSAAIIHHMSYLNYEGFKLDNSQRADEKHTTQQNLFRSNAALFAVGPLLVHSCRDLCGRTPTRLIPGFPIMTASTSPMDQLVGVTFGRMDRESDRIKQGRLAAASFGEALRRGNALPVTVEALRSPQFFMIGLDADAPEDAAEVRELVENSCQTSSQCIHFTV